MYVIDEAMKEFLEGGVAVQVGTANHASRPQIANASGPRINSDGTVSLFVDTAGAAATLANLASNGRIAVVFGDPISYRSIQIKGRWLSSAAPTEAERAWVQRYRELFASAAVLIGDKPEAINNRWSQEITRIDFEVEAAFDQTPGPQAGTPL